MKHFVFLGTVLAISAGALAAGATPRVGSLSTVASFDPAAFELPESVTIDQDGTFYLSMGPTVRRLAPGGELELRHRLHVHRRVRRRLVELDRLHVIDERELREASRRRLSLLGLRREPHVEVDLLPARIAAGS